MIANTINGIIAVDKPTGISSHGVISRLRKALGTRKIGHAGTLDPMATGLLLTGVGQATKLLTFLVGLDKEYLATIRLGASSNTDDAEGLIQVSDLARKAAGEESALLTTARLDTADILSAVASLTGDILQVPSTVSAIKVQGKRAYALARSGQEFSLAARPVNVARFEILASRELTTPEANYLDLDVRISCSSGTYIRALARDLGSALKLGGYLTALRRTRVGPYRVDTATRLDQVSPDRLSASADFAKQIFPWLEVDSETVRRLRHGQKIAGLSLPTQQANRLGLNTDYIATGLADDLVALVQFVNGVAVPKLVF